MLARTLIRLLAFVPAAALLAACAPLRTSSFPPPSADEIGPKLDNYGEAVLPPNGLVVLEGDDLAYGADPKAGRAAQGGAPPRQSSASIGRTLQKVLGRRVKVETRASPGETISKGEARSADAPQGNLVILSYGYGDALAHTPAEVFGAALRQMIQAAHAQGAAVFLLVYPQLKDPTLNGEIEPYRAQMRQIGPETGAEVFEAAQDMTRVGAPPDGVALQPKAYQAIAGGMIPYIRIAGRSR